MDAVKFLAERADVRAWVQKLQSLRRAVRYLHGGLRLRVAGRGVEAWAAAHPRKTRQSEFLKQWPNAMVYSDGVLDIYPCILEKTRKCDKCNEGCTKCRHEFWVQEVE